MDKWIGDGGFQEFCYKNGAHRPIVEEAIKRTKEAREYILNEIMTPAIAVPRKEVGPYAPKIVSIQIDPEKSAMW